MQSMVQGTPSEDLIRELKMHSPTLTRLNDGFRRVYGDVDILTIYEMEPIASLRKNDFDTWERGGPPVMMVEKDSAILYWSVETRIGLSQDHSRIAKVERGQNGCYDDICHFLQKSLGSTHKSHIKPSVNPLPRSSALPSSSKNTREIGQQLCEAIMKGDPETAQNLVYSVEIGWLAKLGGEPLCLAIQHCPEIVSTLLDAGADLSATFGHEGSQAIHTAGRYAKNPDTVQLLLAAGADVNARDDDGWIPLHYAARCNHNLEILQVLIDAGANVNALTTHGVTPLHCAARYRTSEGVTKALSLANADINAQNIHYRTPLHVAAGSNDSIDVIRALIKANADANATTVGGTSPLGDSAFNENPNICRELLTAGANPNHRDTIGRTALHRAVECGNKAVVSHLLESGADPQAMSEDGTPENQGFSESVPTITRNEIRELISKATRTNEGNTPRKKSNGLGRFFR